MHAIIKAIINEAQWEGKFTDDFDWRRDCEDHTVVFVPFKAKDHEVRWAEWLITQNINDWIDMAKEYLVKHGVVKDEPGYICLVGIVNEKLKEFSNVSYLSLISRKLCVCL